MFGEFGDVCLADGEVSFVIVSGVGSWAVEDESGAEFSVCEADSGVADDW